jgi:hypothetical protein
MGFWHDTNGITCELQGQMVVVGGGGGRSVIG